MANFGTVVDHLALAVSDVPTDLWELADRLPDLHGDPMDRMLIAHALPADLPLLTADATIQNYPIRT